MATLVLARDYVTTSPTVACCWPTASEEDAPLKAECATMRDTDENSAGTFQTLLKHGDEARRRWRRCPP